MKTNAAEITKCRAVRFAFHLTPVIVHKLTCSYSQRKYTTADIDISSLQIRP